MLVEETVARNIASEEIYRRRVGNAIAKLALSENASSAEFVGGFWLRKVP